MLAIGIVACTNESFSPNEDKPEYADHTKNNPEKNEDVETGFQEEILDLILQTEVPEDLPTKDHAFVVLGSALSDNGEIQDTLLNRLKVALKAANQYPHSTLIVSGGVPEKGITEADAMYKWLIANGIDKDRVKKEASSTDTVDNALFSLDLAESENIKYITLITSASHMRRALVTFTEINRKNGNVIETPFSHIVYMDYDNQKEAQQVTLIEKALIYRDYLRARGK